MNEMQSMAKTPEGSPKLAHVSKQMNVKSKAMVLYEIKIFLVQDKREYDGMKGIEHDNVVKLIDYQDAQDVWYVECRQIV
jgi:hypothetical protein